ncbi:unnamed protein product [Mycena citricolor]|uniref:Uncharacterized protein n=1 Tax=Mycena citricolor TaxID=2018698 RepID=A0AAD2JXS2_9AGAR|nr:unnamed protein product [Mycena citricolor]
MSWTDDALEIIQSAASLGLSSSTGSGGGTGLVLTIAVFVLLTASITVHYTSPAHLTLTLVAVMHQTEDAFDRLIELGFAVGSEERARLAALRTRVSVMREDTLSDSRSVGRRLRAVVLQGRSLTLMRCIRDVKDFRIHLEILCEQQKRRISAVLNENVKLDACRRPDDSPRSRSNFRIFDRN